MEAVRRAADTAGAMRRLPFLVCALALLAAPASAPAAGPGTGGTSAPSSDGGVTYGQPLRKVRRARHIPSHPVASEFTVAPGTIEAGRPATFAFRVTGAMRAVRVRIELTRAGSPGAGQAAPARLPAHSAAARVRLDAGGRRAAGGRVQGDAAGVRRRGPRAAQDRRGLGPRPSHGARPTAAAGHGGRQSSRSRARTPSAARTRASAPPATATSTRDRT